MESLKINRRLIFFLIYCCYGYTLITQVSTAIADVRTLRIGCSDYVITATTKIQFPEVILAEDRQIPLKLRCCHNI